jgi:putrescine transport system permease protein
MLPTGRRLIQVYAWMGILGKNGFNSALMSVGLIDRPLIILNTNIAVYIVVVYSYLPHGAAALRQLG